MDYKFNKGSEWRKWDLHIHTPYSICQNYGGEQQWDKFIDALEKLPPNVKVIGVNDYYFIDGFEKVMDYKHQGRLANIEKIFPVIEFRIDTFGSGNENKLQKINLHIIFDIDDSNYKEEVQLIRNEFIEQIHITKLDKHRTKILSIENLTIEGGNNLKQGFSDLIPSTEEVLELLSTPRWKDKVILLLGYKEWSNLEKNNQLKPFKEDLYGRVSAFFTSNSQTLSKSQEWLDEYGKKPLLHSEDIHGFDVIDTANKDKNGDYIESQKYQCNTWIKADPTFEGLKQIICEPDRVKIQQTNPNVDRTKYNIIEKVKFIDNSGEERFTDFEIGFSNNLNTIIGGKSSGKSLLMHMMANSLGNHTDNKDYSRLIDNVNLEIYYADAPTKKREKEDKRIVEFLPQLHIENIVRGQSGGNNHKDFNDFIEDILKQSADVQSTFKKEKEIISNKKINLSTAITKWIQQDESYMLLREELLPLGDKPIIQKEIDLIRNQIESLKKGSGLSETELELYNTLSLKNQRAENIILTIKVDIESLNILKQYIKDEIVEGFENSITFQTENKLSLTFLKEIKEDLNSGVNKIINESILPKLESQITRLNSRITKLEQFILNNKGILQPYLEKAQIQDEVKKLEDREKIETDKKKLIKEKEDEIKRGKTKRDETDLIKIYTEIKEVYAKLVNLVNDEISQKWDDGTSGLTLQASVKFNDEDLSGRVQGLVNIKSSLENQFGSNLFDGNDFKYDEQDHIDKIKHFFETVVSDISRFSNFKKGYKLEELLNSIFDNFFFIDYDIKKGSDSIRNMSEGKKGIVILQLYLSLSNAEYPILIDQPEDNLDNRTIYKELNDFVKKSKSKRQIIMVSHNANLVVNTDAENIIVANQMGEDGKENLKFKFEYVNGSLENTFSNESKKGILYQKGIREHVCEILEGGTEAFKKREEKYRIKAN